MENVLIVSSSIAGGQRIQAWLEAEYRCVQVQTQAGALQALKKECYALMVVNAPLSDADGLALCKMAGVDALLFVPQERWQTTIEEMQAYGTVVLAKPVNPHLVMQALSVLRVTRSKVQKLEEKLSETRIVDRAKWALIQTLQMSEKQAHRFIEKQAMDLRISKREVAENIIKTYEN